METPFFRVNSALQIFEQLDDKYAQADTMHQLGILLYDKGEFSQAEQFLQSGLQIFIDFGDDDGQAQAYHELGLVAAVQKEWEKACNYDLHALELYLQHRDNDTAIRLLSNMAGLWKITNDNTIPSKIAPIIDMSLEETQDLLKKLHNYRTEM